VFFDRFGLEFSVISTPTGCGDRHLTTGHNTPTAARHRLNLSLT
jgi:hypothetical protein